MEGNQYAEPEAMADDLFGPEYPPPLMGPRLEQPSFPHHHSHNPQRQESYAPRHSNTYSTPPPTPPNENSWPYNQPHPPPQATSYPYSPDYGHVHHPHTPPRHPHIPTPAHPNSHSQAGRPPPPPPPLKWPTSIVQSASWPIGATPAHTRSKTFGAPLARNEFEHGAPPPPFPTAKAEPTPPRAGRRPERKSALTSATLPSSSTPPTPPPFIGQRWPASLTHSHSALNHTIFEEPEEMSVGSNGAATWTEEGIKKALLVSNRLPSV